ncbi:hypothetical protein FACS1894177_03350 [Bacteroidia bacterium]|nr:hypothetical protein FACS1894177_03350 [Bacteroidia bacterium]
MQKLLLNVAIFLMAFVATTQGQVTIGSALAPSKAALLELKTQEPDGNNVTSTVGGIVLPRVRLVDSNTLQPFIPLDDPEWIADADNVKKKHVGLIVYNVNTSSPFIEGLHIWNGTEWDLTISAVENGMMFHENKIKLGGHLTEDTTTIHLRDKVLIFDSEESPTHAVSRHGGLRFKDLPSIAANSEVLVVDDQTGRIGVRAVQSLPAQMAFFQSKTETEFSTSTSIGENIFVVPWDGALIAAGGDSETNNLIDFISSEHSFELRDTASVEVSGYIGYAGTASGTNGSSAGPGNSIIVNLSIEVKRSGSSTWDQFSSVRGVYYESTAAYRNTLSVPPALLMGYKGDRIRMVVHIKPSGLGVNHSHPRIVVPFGTKFSKSIKIIAQ